MAVILTVVVPSKSLFDSYYYGYGEVKSVDTLNNPLRPKESVTVVVDYGDDEYRANYQAGRFASGLYFAKVEFVD